MPPCGNCGNGLMTSLSMMIASGLLLRQSANLFATSTMVRPANLISLSRIIAAGRVTLERPRQRPQPNGGEGRDSDHRYSCPHAAFARCLNPLSPTFPRATEHEVRYSKVTAVNTAPAQDTAPSAARRRRRQCRHRGRHHRRTFQTFFLTVLLISLVDPIPSLRLRTVAFASE